MPGGNQVSPAPTPSNSNLQVWSGMPFPKANFTPGKLRRMLPRARQPALCPDPEFEVKFSDEAMTHMFSYNSGDLPTWSHEVMYSPWLPPSLAMEKMSGMRNTMQYSGAQRRSSFQDWSGSSLLTLSHAWCTTRNSATPLCEFYYVSLHPNPDAQKMKKVKPFRERKTPYPDTISDMKRPFDHPRDMPTHVVHNLEVRDLPSLPRNLDWCFPELNMYAQTGVFPLHFHKMLVAYFDDSIVYMCDTKEEYAKLTDHFRALDLRHGVPDNYDVPSQVHVDWARWAHERTVNEGYLQEDSYKWLLMKELTLADVVKGMPPPTMRNQFQSPHGLYPQNWPDPDAPGELNTDAHMMAALVMDDYDHRIPIEQVFPFVPFHEVLDPAGLIREAGLLMAMPDADVQAALTYAQERLRIQELRMHPAKSPQQP
eukprot:2515720-Amphidinium_carterae.2